MSIKINLNINSDWTPKVMPILEKWKADGNYSDKVCEAIVFMQAATLEKIYEAIMQYDAKLALAELDKDGNLLRWHITAKNILRNGKNPMNFLTKVDEGPMLTVAQAREVVNQLRVEIERERPELDVKHVMRKTSIVE